LWDLDKTYLVSHFDSLRQLIRIPFQKGTDKVAVPGVAALIRALRRTAQENGRRPRVYFLSASPPQIGSAIRDKLDLDGIDYDGITFKDQVRNLMRGRFDAVLEQIGYKLEQLLRRSADAEAGATELLFGDDWESDPFIYSLYADVCTGAVEKALVTSVLERAEINKHHLAGIAESIAKPRPTIHVDGVFILRQRPALPQDLRAFGPRLFWFDNYFECALVLYAYGYLDRAGVVEVAAALAFEPQRLAESFEAVIARGTVRREWLSHARRALVRGKLMAPVARGNPIRRVATILRRLLGFAPAPPRHRGAVPDYATLVDRWSYRGRKEAVHDTVQEEPAQPGGRTDDRR